MPIVLSIARDTEVSPSKLLMPLSFASILGGTCTLIGTSTNILVSSIATQYGQPPFAMFEFSMLGLIFFGIGMLYLVTMGIYLIPSRRTAKDLTQHFEMNQYLVEIVLLPESKSVGRPLMDSALVHDLDLDILSVERRGILCALPGPDMILEVEDVLCVRCNMRKLQQLQALEGIVLRSKLKWQDTDLESDQVLLVEAIIAPNSELEGKSLQEMRFRNTFGATVLAIRHHGEIVHENLKNMPLRSGDALLIEAKRDRVAQLQQHPAFVMVTPLGGPEFRKEKIVPAVLIIGGVVLSAALNIFPIVVSAIVGCVLLVLTGCLNLEEAYQAIEWRIIFLLAGMLTLGIALEKSGAAALLANLLISGVGQWGPIAVISAFFLCTSLLTGVMSNNATAALLAPIAIVTADTLALNPRPFLMTVMFAASCSFMTPLGYQTNTMVYEAGKYTFADFLRAGTPLNLILWLVATFLIPQFWPF